jgi:RNA polymerase sigma-70 factor (ECF subfamily)
MEAARTLTQLPERMRMRRFTAECEELRPLGIAYVLRHFGHSLDLADAEDAVAEVIIRFDRLAEAGRPPDRLRPAFFTSVRNAAYDLLRYRGVRPTAPLEAAAAKTDDGPGPEQHAESHDDLVRLREAMARMRPNYREAIVLRFGLGLTVPELAERLGISLSAAKKLVLRSTAQIRDRMEAIDGRQFCPEMREFARRSVLDGELAGLTDEPEAAAIKAHLEHCGSCRSFLASLRSDLHELGGTVLLGGLATDKLGLLHRCLSGFHGIAHGVQAGADRVRLASYRASEALTPEDGSSATLLAGTGQKIAAVCTAGAASAATCLATGILGPGLGVATHHHVVHDPPPPPAHVRTVSNPVHHPTTSYAAPENEVAPSESEPTAPVAPRPRGGASQSAAADTTQKTKQPPEHHHTENEAGTPAETEQSQFGIEAESAASAPVEEASVSSRSVTQSQTVETSAPPASSGAESSAPSSGAESSKSTAGGGGHEEFGFGG